MRNDECGMTLIELIMVMALLVVIMAITMPALSGFFRGRQLREEARRFLALTRFARTEAISLSAPMELWLDPKTQAYGLRPLLDIGEDPHLPVTFQMADGLQFTFGGQRRNPNGMAVIDFLPDGTIDDVSLNNVGIGSRDDGAITIQRSEVGIGYMIP